MSQPVKWDSPETFANHVKQQKLSSQPAMGYILCPLGLQKAGKVKTGSCHLPLCDLEACLLQCSFHICLRMQIRPRCLHHQPTVIPPQQLDQARWGK